MRLVVMLAMAFTAACSAGSASAEPVLSPLGLYSGRTVVSGQGEVNRRTGASACLLDVLVKVSGDPTVATDPRVQAPAATPLEYAQGFNYRDRLEGRPLHDEQGSYDRPHYLTVTFDPDKIASLLRSVGRVPWTGDRPRILAVVDVKGRKGSFKLTSDENVDVSEDMRAAFAAAGERFGIVVAIPRSVEWDQVGSRQAREQAPTSATKRDYGATLRGHLVWSDAAMGWIARWNTAWKKGAYAWSVRGVNFDEAFRQGISGMARVASGRGAPLAIKSRDGQ